MLVDCFGRLAAKCNDNQFQHTDLDKVGSRDPEEHLGTLGSPLQMSLYRSWGNIFH